MIDVPRLCFPFAARNHRDSLRDGGPPAEAGIRSICRADRQNPGTASCRADTRGKAERIVRVSFYRCGFIHALIRKLLPDRFVAHVSTYFPMPARSSSVYPRASGRTTRCRRCISTISSRTVSRLPLRQDQLRLPVRRSYRLTSPEVQRRQGAVLVLLEFSIEPSAEQDHGTVRHARMFCAAQQNCATIGRARSTAAWLCDQLGVEGSRYELSVVVTSGIVT